MTALDNEFDTYLSNMTCLSILNLPFETRCMMVRQVDDCIHLINLVNYFEIMCCTLKIDTLGIEVLVMLLYLFFVMIYIFITAIVVNSYLAPVMKIISVKLHMNEYFAGITLLAFANSFPDLISNTFPIRARSALFTRTISNALVIVLVCGGMVCYLKPFKMDGHCTVRDLLFLVFGVEIMSFLVQYGNNVSKTESIILLLVYLVYLMIQLADLILMRKTIRKLRYQMAILRQQPISKQRNDKLRRKMAILIDLESNEDMSIKKRNVNFYSPKNEVHSDSSAFVTPVMKTNTNDVDYVSTRTILHDSRNKKNQFLVSEFFESLNPIDYMDWMFTNSCGRFVMILKSPLVVITKILIPEVNYEHYKHGWSKLLNCFQVIFTPLLFMTLVHSDLANVYKNYSWHISINMSYSIWSLCLTVPAAIYVFFQSRTDVPPYYHFLFLILSGSGSFIVIFMCSAEIEVLTTIVGTVFDLSGNFMDITFGSLINAILDLIAISGAAMQGYEKMAFAATFAGPFFSIIIGMAIPLYFNDLAHEEGSSVWLFGEHGVGCYIFFMITVVSTLWWTLTLNFHSRRSIGIYCWMLVLLFLLYAFAVEFNLIHGFALDPYYPPM